MRRLQYSRGNSMAQLALAVVYSAIPLTVTFALFTHFEKRFPPSLQSQLLVFPTVKAGVGLPSVHWRKMFSPFKRLAFPQKRGLKRKIFRWRQILPFFHKNTSRPPNLGDLRPWEIKKIQSVVDRAAQEGPLGKREKLYVVGSAAKGKRHDIDSNLPLAFPYGFNWKEEPYKSDIDYLQPNSKSRTHQLQLDLPDIGYHIDGVRRLLQGNLRRDWGPAILFRPFRPPKFLPQRKPFGIENK